MTAKKIATRALNANQRRFVREYLIDRSATNAAKRAGYSEKNAGFIGYGLLQKTTIREAIEKALKEQEARTELTADLVHKTLYRILTHDPRKLFDDDGELKTIAELDDDTALSLSGVEVTEILIGGDEDNKLVRTKKYKAHDKRAAADSAAKLLGLVIDKSEVKYDLSNLTPEELMQLRNIKLKLGVT